MFQEKTQKIKRLKYSAKTNKGTQFPERHRHNAYSEEEKRFAIMLMYSSRKTYTMLRTSGVLSRLPHDATIRGWIRDFKCRPGHNSHLMKLLHFKNLASTEKKDNYVVLMLDGMHVKNETKYCASLGELVDGASEVEVVLLRGLYKNWKHVCQFDFDKKMSLEDLKTIICHIQESGLIVKVLVMDLGNHKLQSELEVANMEYRFDNPTVPGESILIMPDPIHGLKNLRNAIIEHGAVINWRGKSVKIGKQDFQAVITEHSKPGEPCILHKVDIIHHLELSKQEKQRVYKAFQLLSRRMANAFRLSGREDQAEIIAVINDYFDVFNSRSAHHFNPLKSGFGKNLELQMKAIEDMRELLMGMKFNPPGKRRRLAMMPFQKGLLMDIMSIIHLKDELDLNPDNFLLLSKVCFSLKMYPSSNNSFICCRLTKTH